MLVGAFAEQGRPSLVNIADLADGAVLDALVNSVALSASTAVIGGVVGALLAYAVVTGQPDGLLRRLVTSICGVLAQFGGVTLAFAFIATLGISGVLSVWLDAHLGTGLTASTWLFGLPGLALVYSLLPDPADGDRLPAGAGRHPACSGGRRHPTSAPPPGSTGGTSPCRC